MSILKTIEAYLTKSGFVTVDIGTWEERGEMIAGFTHLPRRDQLIMWAQNLGYVTDYSPESNLLKISKHTDGKKPI